MYYDRYRYCVLDRLQYVLECHTTLPGTVLRCSSTQYGIRRIPTLQISTIQYSEHMWSVAAFHLCLHASKCGTADVCAQEARRGALIKPSGVST